MQDDPEDWTQEAKKMGEYYRNSTLTIAADDAKASSEGFLQPRRPTAVHGAPIGVYTFPDGSRRHLTVGNINRASWAGSALEKRAWTLQERVLSSRILHYTHNGLFWECRTISWHESGGSRPPYTEFQTLPSRAEHDYDPQGLSLSWESLVQNFSSRQLSVLADKLPALSGLAAMYAEMHGQKKYLAGLWAHETPRCLLWNVLSSYKPSEPVLAYRAPSWSWASMNAGVYYPEEELDMFDTVKPLPGFNIVDADVKERSPGSFMHVTEGYIAVMGTLYSARYLDRGHQLGSYYRGSLETSLPGLRKGEWKGCFMDTDYTERDCCLLPCMISNVDVDKDDTHFILRQVKRADFESDEDEENSVDGENTEDIVDQGDEEEMRIEEQIHASYRMEGHGNKHSDRSRSKRSKSDEAGREGDQSDVEQPDSKRSKHTDSSSKVEDACRIYMLVLEESLPRVTNSDNNDNRDKDKKNEIRTFRRVGLAYWKVSMAQIHKLPNVERIRIE